MHRNNFLAGFLFGIALIPLGWVITRQDLRSRRGQHVLVDQETIGAMFPDAAHSNAAASTAFIYVMVPQRMRVGYSAPVSIEVFTSQRRRLYFRLSASGMEVEPNDWIPLHAVADGHLVALWSISASSPSPYSLVFNVKIDQPSSKVETVVVRFFPSDNLTIDVVRGWDDYLHMASGPFVTFMGSLLTLPGIISFFQNRKRKRDEQSRAIQTVE
jgi:hypothetical protein